MKVPSLRPLWPLLLAAPALLPQMTQRASGPLTAEQLAVLSHLRVETHPLQGQYLVADCNVVIEQNLAMGPVVPDFESGSQGNVVIGTWGRIRGGGNLFVSGQAPDRPVYASMIVHPTQHDLPPTTHGAVSLGGPIVSHTVTVGAGIREAH